EDAHSVANSLTWGPDGWLYGCQGSTVTAHIRGLEFQQGIWRYHPLTHQFELFCEGGGNSWGLDFDAEGELIYSTTLGPYRHLHGVQGPYYWKSFGKRGSPTGATNAQHIRIQTRIGIAAMAGSIASQRRAPCQALSPISAICLLRNSSRCSIHPTIGWCARPVACWQTAAIPRQSCRCA